MGWDFIKGMDKQGIVNHILKDFNSSTEVLGHALVGKNLWVTVSSASIPNGPLVVLFLLDSDPGYGWGYKEMDESMGPYYYDCPLKLLMGPGTHNQSSIDWRAKVYEWHKRNNKRNKILGDLE